MAWYRAGTASFTSGSKNVTGSGTAWVGNVRPGDEIVGPDGRSYEVETVTADTALAMVETYVGTTAAGAFYKVKPIQGWNRDVAAQLAALINDYGSIENALTVAGGNVGIGVPSPTQRLDVSGSVRIVNVANPNIRLDDGTRTHFIQTASGNLDFYAAGAVDMTFTVNGARRAMVDSSGNIGIGIVPTVKLDVGESGDAAATMLRMQSGGYATTVSHDATATVIANNSAIRGIALAPNGTTRLLADNAGVRFTGTVRMDVATGTTAPSAGGAGALPATPAGYMTINVGGTDRKIPYYA